MDAAGVTVVPEHLLRVVVGYHEVGMDRRCVSRSVVAPFARFNPIEVKIHNQNSGWADHGTGMPDSADAVCVESRGFGEN
jgi:hypothetical protein